MKTGRRTATVVTFVGALGLSVLNAPAAQAADTGITVSGIVINNGKPIVVGTSKVVEPPLRFNIALPPGTAPPTPSATRRSRSSTGAASVRRPRPVRTTSGRAVTRATRRTPNTLAVRATSTSTRTGPRITSTPTATPRPGRSASRYGCSSRRRPEDRGTGDALHDRPVPPRGQAHHQRLAGTGHQGKPITVTGKLTRANWSTKKYGTYSGRTVGLQFRAKGTDTFKTIKKATTSSTGGLKTTVTASVDGYYRWVYNGNTTTGATTSTADYIDVR